MALTCKSLLFLLLVVSSAVRQCWARDTSAFRTAKNNFGIKPRNKTQPADNFSSLSTSRNASTKLHKTCNRNKEEVNLAHCWAGEWTDFSISPNDSTHSAEDHDGIQLIGLNPEVSFVPLIITFILITASVLKIGLHHCQTLSKHLPESCVLLILGVVVGLIANVWLASYNQCLRIQESFNAHVFFLYLLPAIMLDSAYSLHDREFINNLATILMHAIIGTLFNTFAIGVSLWGLSAGGMLGSSVSLGIVEVLVFSSLISAVDPVAVLAIFQEIGVNAMLYFLLFGEALLNDAVSVVLYQTLIIFNTQEDNITSGDIGMGIAKFLVVNIGGFLVGLICGLLTAVITKHSGKVRVAEPLTMLVMAYAAYIVSDLLYFSGIIGIITCGLLQWQYAVHNISFKSRTTVKYASKMMASFCDAIIFLTLGITIADPILHKWNAQFILWTLLLCLVFRFIGVYALTWLVNQLTRIQKVTWQEQFVVSYGGLRGAVAFSLALLLVEDDFCNKEVFVTTTVVVVLFTVFIQGTTIRPLVNKLGIRKQEAKKPSLFQSVNLTIFDHVMAGMEKIVGRHGKHYYREKFEHFEYTYLKPWLQKVPTEKDRSIVDTIKGHIIRDLMEEIKVVPAENDSKRSSVSSTPALSTPVKETGEPTLISLDARRGTRAFSNTNGFVQRNDGKPASALGPPARQKISTVSLPSERWLESFKTVLSSRNSNYSLDSISTIDENNLETQRF
ncbi:hypothetical protein RvY_12313 [Ramazzottius varieornatus]|uniref:Sodium/hydrogen exchanger n=1 Tax=Ramazzottius varieornatus TaxID=947166 RepID=A0A1D1VJ54_RAMVA|nr:hypothetical protein RvY_12313 [Ramazzottius varieornatus]